MKEELEIILVNDGYFAASRNSFKGSRRPAIVITFDVDNVNAALLC